MNSTGMYGNSGYGSSYGSSYGGYGGGMGGFGSSYGGYGGGMGGMYGGGMYNRLGMGSDPNAPPGLMQNSMMFLNSFGVVLNSLGEIARTMEMHAQGLIHLCQSTGDLCKRVKGWGVHFVIHIREFAIRIYEKLMSYIKSKVGFLLANEGSNDEMSAKIKMKVFSTALKVALIIFAVSMVPVLGKMLRQDANEAIFNNL